jgi:DNA segregation ATPase FtsK/SpoIIIE, S-DNA-T family
MAKKKLRIKPQAPSQTENSLISTEKKKKILGVFLIVFSLLVLISIISYSRFDLAILNYQFSDLFKVFGSDDDFLRKADGLRNWLGIFGAYLSDFFINSTFGIFSSVFPVLFFLWGYNFIQKINFRKLIHTSNLLLIAGLILSTFFGVLNASYGVFESMELSGRIGLYFGEALSRLLGGIGSIIFLAALTTTLLILVFDIKIEKIFQFLRESFSSSVSTIKEEYENSKAGNNEETENLKKIKELRTDKKEKRKKKIPAGQMTAEELMKEEAAKELEDEETRITIIRKNFESAKVEENAVLKEEDKKVDLEKIGELNSAGIDREKELALPNQWEEKINFKRVGLDLLEPAPVENFKVAEEELTRNAELLKEKLKLFDIAIKDISVTPGPVVTLYEIVPEPGVKISKIVGLENDIALALAAKGIRIIAPIPGKERHRC